MPEMYIKTFLYPYMQATVTMRHVIVGTAGHIDHGKSALARALTGTTLIAQRKSKRGITIDLGFANLDLGDVQVGFGDIPGHEKFVKNILAGAGGIDFLQYRCAPMAPKRLSKVLIPG
jgi:translation elongation factor EF-Tu-like GTPase